jgi:hypothetical protein
MTVAWDHVTRADVLRAVQEYDRASALPPLISRAASPVPSGWVLEKLGFTVQPRHRPVKADLGGWAGQNGLTPRVPDPIRASDGLEYEV